MPKPILTVTGTRAASTRRLICIFGADRIGEDHVGAGFRIGARTPQHALDALDRQRVRARDDGKSIVPASQAGRFDLFHTFDQGYHLLAGHVPAALRMHLVLDIDAGKPRLLEHLHRVVHVHGIAVAGVGIGGQRDGEGAGQHPAMVDVFRKSHHPDIVDAEERIGNAGARRGSHLEAGLFDQAGAVAVVDAGGDDQPASCQELTEFLGAVLHLDLPELRACAGRDSCAQNRVCSRRRTAPAEPRTQPEITIEPT